MPRARVRDALDVSQLAAICNSIGDAVAEEGGYVSIRALLAHFRAQLVMRPLLVEAMIATVDDATDGLSGNARWAVLVDSERYAVNDKDILEESSAYPLPVRFRNTVAHELAHSLAFRPTEFGLQLTRNASTDSRRQFVDEIEQAIEKMSPLLLLPDQALRKILRGKTRPLTAAQLKLVCNQWGVSREVLVNRLAMLRQHSDRTGLRDHAALFNLAVGVGEWTAQGDAIFRKWPLYIHFDNGVVPSFLMKLASQDRVAAKTVIDAQESVLVGGREYSGEMTLKAGLPGAQTQEDMRVAISVEVTSRRAGYRFLFAVSNCRPPAWQSNRTSAPAAFL